MWYNFYRGLVPWNYYLNCHCNACIKTPWSLFSRKRRSWLRVWLYGVFTHALQLRRIIFAFSSKRSMLLERVINSVCKWIVESQTGSGLIIWCWWSGPTVLDQGRIVWRMVSANPGLFTMTTHMFFWHPIEQLGPGVRSSKLLDWVVQSWVKLTQG